MEDERLSSKYATGLNGNTGTGLTSIDRSDQACVGITCILHQARSSNRLYTRKVHNYYLVTKEVQHTRDRE